MKLFQDGYRLDVSFPWIRCLRSREQIPSDVVNDPNGCRTSTKKLGQQVGHIHDREALGHVKVIALCFVPAQEDARQQEAIHGRHVEDAPGEGGDEWTLALIA